MDQYQKNQYWLKQQQEMCKLEEHNRAIENRILLGVSCVLVFLICITLWAIP